MPPLLIVCAPRYLAMPCLPDLESRRYGEHRRRPLDLSYRKNRSEPVITRLRHEGKTTDRDVRAETDADADLRFVTRLEESFALAAAGPLEFVLVQTRSGIDVG